LTDVRTIGEHEMLDGEDVAPGLACLLGSIL